MLTEFTYTKKFAFYTEFDVAICVIVVVMKEERTIKGE
jgi:hypothetical protein